MDPKFISGPTTRESPFQIEQANKECSPVTVALDFSSVEKDLGRHSVCISTKEIKLVLSCVFVFLVVHPLLHSARPRREFHSLRSSVDFHAKISVCNYGH